MDAIKYFDKTIEIDPSTSLHARAAPSVMRTLKEKRLSPNMNTYWAQKPSSFTVLGAMARLANQGNSEKKALRYANSAVAVSLNDQRPYM